MTRRVFEKLCSKNKFVLIFWPPSVGRTPRGSCDNTPSKKSSWKVSRDCFREGSKKAS